jgi:hypothetical protein|tara:strand:+ start:492 stop:776 length:285 start_codon:yes stop_codon:yes gene_type:complete
MPSNLPSKLFTQLLDERLSSDVDMSRIHSLVKDDKTKSLNYEILYKFLESAVEEFILVNHGNPLVDDFRSKVFDKMGDVLNLLMGGTIDKNDQN